MPTPPTALLIIDVQQGLFEKATPIYRTEALLDNILALAERARSAGVPVIYIQHSSKTVLPWGSDDWQLHPRLRPLTEDLTVHKTHPNAFEDTTLEAELKQRGIGRLVLTGLVTHGCVKATCLGALEKGYQVILAADAHSNYHKKAAQVIAEWNTTLAEAHAEVVTAAEIMF